jgi:hypothetical protein
VVLAPFYSGAVPLAAAKPCGGGSVGRERGVTPAVRSRRIRGHATWSRACRRQSVVATGENRRWTSTCFQNHIRTAASWKGAIAGRQLLVAGSNPPVFLEPTDQVQELAWRSLEP